MTNRISTAEINLYHGGREAYLAACKHELAAAQATLAGGEFGVEVWACELGFSAETERAATISKIENLTAAISANAQ